MQHSTEHQPAPATDVSKQKQQHWVDFIHGSGVAWIILIISLFITVIAWTISNNYADQIAKERFEFQIEEAQDAIHKRFINYEQVLRGALGLFKASSNVERSEWQAYIASLRIDEYFPGTLGVGYSKWLKPDQLESHINQIKQQGFPDFSVRPEGVRDEYSSIIFLEPFNERNQRAFGYDMYSEPTRREAMARARDSGKTALSGKVTLVQEASSGVQAGFLIYLPHYQYEANTLEERREALIGFVYSALRMGDLMQGILGVGLPELDFTLLDGVTPNRDNLLYETNALTVSSQSSYVAQFQQQQTLDIGGHIWTINYRTNPVFDKITSSSQPTLVAIGGIIIDLLLFNVILSLSRLRSRAQALADERMKKLSERELQFKAITDNANDGIISFDAQGEINYINNSMERLFGYSFDKIIGKPVTMLFPTVHQAVIKNTYSPQIDNSGSHNNELLELDGINKHSEIFPLEFSLARWQLGDKTQFTGIIRDITERKKVDKLKNEFISTVSHELRTPLTAISGSLSLVENGVTGTVNEASLKLINNANRNALRLANLVNDLLDSEKMASGTMRYDIKECEVTDLIDKSLEINRSVAEQSNILLTFTTHEPVMVLVDPDRFIQVMTNLIANAIKFSSAGDAIDTSIQLINNELRVAVTDHGSGVPKEFRSQIFSKFAQADSSDTRKHGGTGLGLSIVKYIIEQFNGRIDYTSIPNEETTFFFFIPIGKNI